MNRFLLFLLSGASAAACLYWRELASQPKTARRETEKKVPAKIGIHNGHEYIDLGLSVLWATCNIGATRPEDYGDYFAWGETETKKYYGKSNLASSEDISADSICGTENDAAHVRWGGGWRMPTEKEAREMSENCTRTFMEKEGVRGCELRGKNGGRIFFPAAGMMTCEFRAGDDATSFYWIGDVGRESDMRWGENFSFNYDKLGIMAYTGADGLTVRPVLDRKFINIK